jgi:hypothetical protein
VSAPTSHDPVAVNTSDDRCWVRRGWSPDGRGLYALEGTAEDATQTLFLIRELAAFGLRSMAYLAVPMPAGSVVEADGLPAPTQALQLGPLAEWVAETFSPKPVNGEFHETLHHPYRVGHDMPDLGGQR